jgi:hypothetical protein
MWTTAIVVADPFAKEPTEMALREWNHKVQALSPYRANQSFAMGIGLGRLGWRSQHRQPKSLCQFVVKISGEDRVSIMNKKPISLLAWDRFPKLLRGPFCRGVRSNIAA